MRPVQILLAEDSVGDVVLVRKAIESMDVPTQLTVVEDGQQLLRYLVDALKLENTESALPFPDVVLIDLNMRVLAAVAHEERYDPGTMEPEA